MRRKEGERERASRNISIMRIWFALFACSLLGPAQDPKIDWLTDLDAAREKAKSEGKPLLVVFR